MFISVSQFSCQLLVSCVREREKREMEGGREGPGERERGCQLLSGNIRNSEDAYNHSLVI